MASLGLRNLYPDMNFYEEQAVMNMLDVYQFDSLKSSHPVSVPVHRAEQVAEIFDHISYKKGAAVLRMMHLFLGEQAFREGVSNYLKRNQYGNADQDDLWNELTLKAHEYYVLPKHITVKKVMDTWTLQTGYPVITVERDYKTNKATITQKRFLNDKTATDEKSCWWVPLTFTTSRKMSFQKSTPSDWLECDEDGKRVTLVVEDMPPADEWVMYNIGVSGIYKVQYDQKNWDMITSTFNSTDFDRINLMNRANVVADVLDLAW